jgi:hypothetical protein
MLDKVRIIELISEINRSARRDWLAAFDHDSLRLYLEHLQRTIEPRGGHSTWVRPGDTPAVVTRRPLA